MLSEGSLCIMEAQSPSLFTNHFRVARWVGLTGSKTINLISQSKGCLSKNLTQLLPGSEAMDDS